MSEQEHRWVGFDLGGTKMLATIYDDQLNCLGRERKKTKGFLGAEAGMERIVKAIHDALEDASLKPEQLSGIGIGCPGPVNPESGTLIHTPNLGWEKISVTKILRQEFQVPVMLMNDVDAGVYGEFCLGAGRGVQSVLGVFPGTGVGGGFVYEGEIFQRRNLSCMEIGHIPVMPEGPLSSAGLSGSLESVTSRLAISAMVAQASYRGQAPYVQEECGSDLSEIRSGVLANAIEAGDQRVEEIITDVAIHLGKCIGGMVHMLAPERIVLGGGLVEAMPKLFIKSVKQGLQQWLLPGYKDCFDLKVAELGDNASAIGAAAWAKHSILDKQIASESIS